MGIAEGLEAALFWHRAKAILLLFGLFAALIAWWGASNLVALWAGRSGWWWLSSATAAEIGLTLGTLALATAAFIQARAAAGQREDAFHQIEAADRLALAAQRQAEAIREQTLALSTAHLRLERLGEDGRYPAPASSVDFETRLPEVRVHNAGPGVARGLQWRVQGLSPGATETSVEPSWVPLALDVLGVGQSAAVPLGELSSPGGVARRSARMGLELQVRVGKGPGAPADVGAPGFAKLLLVAPVPFESG